MAAILYLLCTLSTALAQTTPNDFAQGMQVETVDGAPLQAVMLPPEIYRTVTRSDLGDLRVFNGSGAELPYAIYHDAEAQAAPKRTVTLPVFPIRGQPDVSLDRLTVQVRSLGSGTLVQVQEREAAANNAPPLRAYIVDAHTLDTPLRTLTFAWADSSDFIADFTVQMSDDLTRWERWGTTTTLANLTYGDNRLHRDEIDLPPRKANYLRITWSSNDSMPPIDRLLVTPADPDAEPEREWMSFDPAQTTPHRYLFDQQGVLPIDRARLLLPEMNTLARIELESASAADGPWRTRYQGLVYRLTIGGHELNSPNMAFTRTTDRYWRVQVDPAGGGLGSGTPKLELGWLPERLLFVARGEAPYTLAYGSATAEPAGFHPQELLRLVPNQRDGVLGTRTAALGPATDLGGPARLQPNIDLPWTQVLLWGVLLLGVGLLAMMSLRLLRQTDKETPTAEEQAG